MVVLDLSLRSWVTVLTLMLAAWVCGQRPMGAAAYSMGAPSSACGNMFPGHQQMAMKPPARFSLALTSTGKRGEDAAKRAVALRLYSQLGLPFKGYLVQALANGTNSPMGRFTLEDSSKGKLLSCGVGLDNAVTHPDGKSKKAVDLVWHAPDDYEGIIVFNATFVQDYSTFWVGIVSDPLRITKRSPGNEDGNDPSVATIRPPTTTRPPTRLRPNLPANDSTTKMSPSGPSVASKAHAPLYDGCFTTKLCFGMPEGCITQKNCHTLVTVIVAGNQYEFEMLALPVDADVQYVAVGLSSDKKMGEDSVVECALEPSGSVNLYTSHNDGRSNKRNPNKNGISLISSLHEEGAIGCRFTREANTVVEGKEYDLVNDKFCILLAAGNSLKENGVGYHNTRRESTENPQYLSDVGEIKGASKVLLRLHGCLMIAAWLLCASTGILLARYFKRTWTGSQTCGKDQWFAWHRMLMLLAWSLTVAGFVVIFVELGEWSHSADPHATLGTITTALATIQPIMAAFRPGPTGKRRPLFNWAHWLVGNMAHILAVVTIFFAVKLVKADLPMWLDWVLVAYVAFYVFIHLIFSISGCVSEKESTKRVNSFAMKDLSSSRSPLEMAERSLDAPYSCLRKFLLAVYIVGILAVTVAIIVIIALAPIKENWSDVTQIFTQ